jgi:hypothetical protein
MEDRLKTGPTTTRSPALSRGERGAEMMVGAARNSALRGAGGCRGGEDEEEHEHEHDLFIA